MFVDASAICAVILREPDGDTLYRVMLSTDRAMTSPTAAWESCVAVSRIRQISPSDALTIVEEFLETVKVRVFAIPPEATILAVEAFERFGKGRHPAGLNFGDCFAYACARHFGVPLLYKGDDFARTDIAAA